MFQQQETGNKNKIHCECKETTWVMRSTTRQNIHIHFKSGKAQLKSIAHAKDYSSLSFFASSFAFLRKKPRNKKLCWSASIFSSSFSVPACRLASVLFKFDAAC